MDVDCNAFWQVEFWQPETFVHLQNEMFQNFPPSIIFIKFARIVRAWWILLPSGTNDLPRILNAAPSPGSPHPPPPLKEKNLI